MFIDYINNYKDLIKSTKIVIVYFYNYECSKTNNIFNSLKREQNVLYLKYDIEDKNCNKLIEYLDIKVFPYFYIYKNGELIDKILGTLNIEKILEQYIST